MRKRNGELPTEAQPPHLKIKTLEVLGNPTCEAKQLEKDAKLGAEQLHAAALAERQRRVDAGITDDVQDVMPLQPPALTQAALGEKRLEVC